MILGSNRVRNGVSISVDKELVDLVVEVKCKSDSTMAIKVVVGSEIQTVIIVCTPQIGLAEDMRWSHWEDLHMVI